MNYRHGYHAGNFADVHKHVVLMASLAALCKKDAPLFVLDTHAGRGYYDLAIDAQKSKEYLTGITQIQRLSQRPPLVDAYFSAYAALSQGPLHYPGSPRFVSHVLRPTDRAAFCELEPSECRFLGRLFSRDNRIGVHQRDGYEALKALLPPKERRGLILIDPPFEQSNEYVTLTNALLSAHQAFASGVYLVWYPLKADGAQRGFIQALKSSGVRKILNTEVWVEPKDSPVGLLGSGLLLINPPWQLDQALMRDLPILAQSLSLSRFADSSVQWLVGE